MDLGPLSRWVTRLILRGLRQRAYNRGRSPEWWQRRGSAWLGHAEAIDFGIELTKRR